ncbi:Panacea domain-containing protein [Chitinophaga sp. Hz27]|uniref:Panacea domain-containing protein n=1 Tax=Chitinophaga sp. Hz27 TaxID=3347169 RepID=UPI0035D74D94
MYKVEAIANYFIEKGVAVDYPLNQIILQKLLYYAYGWGLVMSDREKLFDAPIQTYACGPVIFKIYHQLKHLGMEELEDPIPRFRSFIFENLLAPRLNPKNKRDKRVIIFLDAIWREYSGLSPIYLTASLLAEGTPWDKLKKKYGRVANGTNIDDQMLIDYFLPLKKKQEQLL